jgi:hypothetical protein
MRRFRAIVAILILVLTMPLAHAGAVLSSAAGSQRACCHRKADACCEGPANLCCATHAPADAPLVAFQAVSPLLLPPLPVAVVHADRIDRRNLLGPAIRLPAEYSPPGLMIVGTILLRI